MVANTCEVALSVQLRIRIKKAAVCMKGRKAARMYFTQLKWFIYKTLYTLHILGVN